MNETVTLKPLPVALLAVLGSAANHFLFWGPTLIIIVFWALDFALGFALAWRASRLSPTRMARSVVKLILWTAAMMICYGFRESGEPLLAPVASVGIVMILTVEGSSVLRNLALLAPGTKQAAILARFAARVDQANPANSMATEAGKVEP